MKRIGAHVSTSGGVENAPLNAEAIGAKAFAMFTKNQRQWQAKPYSEKNIQEFKANLSRIGIAPDHVLPHDGYLINLGHPETDQRQKSREAFLDEMHRWHGLTSIYVTHNLSFAGRCDRVLKLDGGALTPCLLEEGKAYV